MYMQNPTGFATRGGGFKALLKLTLIAKRNQTGSMGIKMPGWDLVQWEPLYHNPPNQSGDVYT